MTQKEAYAGEVAEIQRRYRDASKDLVFALCDLMPSPETHHVQNHVLAGIMLLRQLEKEMSDLENK